MPTTDPTYLVCATARLNAPPRRVYDTIANYHTGHPRILPKQFRNLTVEKGGVGAGTVIRFQVKVFGRTDTFRAEITEPDPGRILVEKNILGSDSVTTFIVEPGPQASEALVTIQTELKIRKGWAGAIERFMTERVLRPMYAEELRLLEAAAADPRGTAATTNS
jgi:Polyketide cyclase / dehydrase and lipid transport